MSFFCPKCHSSIAGEQTFIITCKACGLRLDLQALDTRAGRAAPLASPVALLHDHSGETLGRYQLRECLGVGGMGSVYRATDTDTARVVAVKVLFPALVAQPDLLERFHREAAFLKGLSHPNVVGFLDQGESEHVHYLVMEYVEGPTLERHLSDRGVLSVSEAVTIVSEIASALQSAHALGIVHRDLKPANVLLSAGGAKVVDFGVAHMAADELTLTHSDAILGTFNYMAPEQRLRAKAIDARADIFSLATILYRMLTGTLPMGRYEAATRLNKQLARGFDVLLSRALHPNPDRRQADMATFARELDRLRPRPRSFSQLAPAAFAFVCIAVALGIWQWPQPPAPLSSPTPVVISEDVGPPVLPPLEDPLPGPTPGKSSFGGKSKKIISKKPPGKLK